ncbi:MAG: SLC13 family permease [Verrucomicrobiota bacterium]
MNHAILAQLPQFLLNEAGAPSTPWLLTVLVASIALLLVLILVARVQAFVSLLLTSVFVAIFSGMPLTEIADTISGGMASALGVLATIVGLGAIFGQVMEYSGGAQSLATTLHRGFGEKRAPAAMILVGFLISIPVFFDVALVILAPILVAMAKNSGKSILRYGLPLCAAMAVTHACIPPTPGPILVALNLGADLGQVILWGFIVGFPTAVVAGFVGARMGDKIQVPIPKIFEEAKEQPEGGKKPVPAWEVIALILLPIALILGQSLVKGGLREEADALSAAKKEAAALAAPERQAYVENAVAGFEKHRVVIPADFNLDGVIAVPNGAMTQIMLFIGHPISALLLTTLVTLILLGTLRGIDKATLMDLSTKALGPAGIIILVTGAGGVFKAILVGSGVGGALAEFFKEYVPAPLIVLSFLLTTVIRVTQGSATVAMIGGSALMAESVKAALAAGEIGRADVALIGIAIACGASMLSHVNDSGFWVVKNYLGMTEKQCLSTFTVITTVIGLTGFTLAWIFSMIF